MNTQDAEGYWHHRHHTILLSPSPWNHQIHLATLLVMYMLHGGRTRGGGGIITVATHKICWLSKARCFYTTILPITDSRFIFILY